MTLTPLPRLETEVVPGLVLRDPFMIASSHWTAGAPPFRQLAASAPAALTLKTTSTRKGGDGHTAFGKRVLSEVTGPTGLPLGRYTDGPPTLEFWDIPTTHLMTHEARVNLPNTVLGLSVLKGEDYGQIARGLPLGEYGYVELNWKYTFRSLAKDTLESDLNEIVSDLSRFLAAFHGKPLLVKLPREAAFFARHGYLAPVFTLLAQSNGGIIVANSLRTRVPCSRTGDRNPKELAGGVLVGEALFLDTYDLLREISSLSTDDSPVVIPPLVASGGITDIGAVLDALFAGARALQLCTFLDRKGPAGLIWLREQLAAAIVQVLDGDLKGFVHTISNNQPAYTSAETFVRRVMSDEREGVEDLLNGADILALLEQSLAIECRTSSGSLLDELVAKPSVPDDIVFVSTRGNASSFLLARQAIMRLGVQQELELESAAEFGKKLASPQFRYDFAILPESTLEHLGKQRAGVYGDLQPVKLGEVAVSVVELVGDTSLGIGAISQVYYFGGNSARHALGSLFQEHHPEDETELSGPELVPLLRYWRPSSAILAKPPLSRIYGLLTDSATRERWGAIWSTTEPLFLVASRRVYSRSDGDHLCQYVLDVVQREREEILRRPRQAARRLRSEGFVASLKTLLTK